MKFTKQDLFHTVMFHRHARTAEFFLENRSDCGARLHRNLAEKHLKAISSSALNEAILSLVQPYHRLGLAILDTAFRTI